MFQFGARSKSNLDGVHPSLASVANLAITISEVDFLVLQSVRTQEEQDEKYAQGRTKPGPIIAWTRNSKHIKQADGYSHAVDLAPYPIDWNDTKKFDAIAKAMFEAAKRLGVSIKWGADWDRDGIPRERGETDSPHFELV